MKKYNRLSHSIWHCTYHIVFCPKYRYKVLEGKSEVFVRNQLYRLCGQKNKVEIEEINIQPDHVHLIISIPPKYSVSEVMGYLKGKVAIKLFGSRKDLTKQYWGKHLWSRGYCVSTVGLDEDKIKKYVKWQQQKEQKG
ncbi:MAG: IS200/IS605 family transposase [Patescibacteria group bacterium]